MPTKEESTAGGRLTKAENETGVGGKRRENPVAGSRQAKEGIITKITRTGQAPEGDTREPVDGMGAARLRDEEAKREAEAIMTHEKTKRNDVIDGREQIVCV